MPHPPSATKSCYTWPTGEIENISQCMCTPFFHCMRTSHILIGEIFRCLRLAFPICFRVKVSISQKDIPTFPKHYLNNVFIQLNRHTAHDVNTWITIPQVTTPV